jgi:AcrR family transcriptional regulator
MRARAAAVDERRERVLQAAHAMLVESSWDDVTLEGIARRAGVALKTAVRQFRSKEELLGAAIRWHAPREAAMRSVIPGDVEGAARVLAERYDEMSPVIERYRPLEDRISAVAEIFAFARDGHLQWLEQTFAPWLPARRSVVRRQRLAALFGATELYVWHVWRHRLGWSRRVAEGALFETLQSLVDRWSRKTARRP